MQPAEYKRIVTFEELHERLRKTRVRTLEGRVHNAEALEKSVLVLVAAKFLHRFFLDDVGHRQNQQAEEVAGYCHFFGVWPGSMSFENSSGSTKRKSAWFHRVRFKNAMDP